MRILLTALACAAAISGWSAALADDVANNVSPVPQVSFSVPNGWIVCNELTGKKSGNGVDPASFQKTSCSADAPTDIHMILTSTDSRNPSLAFLVLRSDASLARNSLSDIGEAYYPKIESALCGRAAIMLQLLPDTCKVEFGQLAGGTAFLGHASGSIAGKQSKADVRIVELTYTGGTMLAVLAGAADRPNPDIDAFIDSFSLK